MSPLRQLPINIVAALARVDDDTNHLRCVVGADEDHSHLRGML